MLSKTFIIILLSINLILLVTLYDIEFISINSVYRKLNTYIYDLDIIVDHNHINPINKYSIFVYNAYLKKFTYYKDKPGEWYIRMAAIADCHLRDKYVFPPMTFTTGGKTYVANILKMEGNCGTHWAFTCFWGPYTINVKIPDGEIDSIGSDGILKIENRTLYIPKIERSSSTDYGLSLCIAPLYWYTDWPRIIEFIEVWKRQGASKIFVYYQAVTREVYEVLKVYEQTGILELLKSEVMPINKTTKFNPDAQLFRLGDRIFQNECVLRAKTKFMAYIDFDEILIPQHNQTMLEFLEVESRKNEHIGAFRFPHAALKFDKDKMPHLKASEKDFDWKKMDYEWLKTAHHWPNRRGDKTISMPAKVNLVNIHAIQSFQWPYYDVGVPFQKVVYYHPRNDLFALSNKTEFDKVEKQFAQYQATLKSFFNNNFIQHLRMTTKYVMEKVEKALKRKPYPYYQLKDIFKKCMKGWRHGGKCSPYAMCYEDLHNFTDWVYANPSRYETSELLIL